jgi:hypothetical protein
MQLLNGAVQIMHNACDVSIVHYLHNNKEMNNAT